MSGFEEAWEDSMKGDAIVSSQYLNFVLVHGTGKTRIYSVDSRSQGSQLAVIRWYEACRD